jgi:hypothetical protein
MDKKDFPEMQVNIRAQTRGFLLDASQWMQLLLSCAQKPGWNWNIQPSLAHYKSGLQNMLAQADDLQVLWVDTYPDKVSVVVYCYSKTFPVCCCPPGAALPIEHLGIHAMGRAPMLMTDEDEDIDEEEPLQLSEDDDDSPEADALLNSEVMSGQVRSGIHWDNGT